jgi:hypothetical protein
VIGWVILAALLIPALALGRWAERERRRAQGQARTEVIATPPRARRRAHAPGRPARAAVSAGRVFRRSAARRSRTYAGR